MAILNEAYKVTQHRIEVIIKSIMQTVSYNPEMDSLQTLATDLVTFINANMKTLPKEWILKMMQYHYEKTDLMLKEKETLSLLWKDYKEECLEIGDDIIRLGSMVDKVDIVTVIFKELYENHFKLYNSLISKHTDLSFYELSFSHKLLKYLKFYLSLKDNSNDNYYFKWMAERCFLRNKEVRYVNFSDSRLDRSKIIKYLFHFTNDTYVITNLKLAFSFDWIFCLPNISESTDILLPSFTLIMDNLQKDPEFVNSIIEFVIILSRKYNNPYSIIYYRFCPALMQELCKNLHYTFLIFKRFYKDMKNIVNCVNLSPNIVNILTNDYKDIFDDVKNSKSNETQLNDILLHQNSNVASISPSSSSEQNITPTKRPISKIQKSSNAKKRKVEKGNNNIEQQTEPIIVLPPPPPPSIIHNSELEETQTPFPQVAQPPLALSPVTTTAIPPAQPLPVVSPIIQIQPPIQYIPITSPPPQPTQTQVSSQQKQQQKQQKQQQNKKQTVQAVTSPVAAPTPTPITYTVPIVNPYYNQQMQCITTATTPPGQAQAIRIVNPSFPPTVQQPSMTVATISPMSIYPNPAREVINIKLTLFDSLVKENFSLSLFRRLMNEECNGSKVQVIVSKLVEEYTLKYPCIKVIESIQNSFFDKDVIVGNFYDFINKLYNYYPFIIVFLMINCITFSSNLFLRLFKKLLKALNKADNELYCEMFYYYKKLLDSNGTAISPLEVIISKSLKSIAPFYSYTLLHNKELLHILVTIMPETTKLEVMASLRQEEWLGFDHSYVPIFNQLDDWTVVEQYIIFYFISMNRHRLWDIALSQASFHAFIPEIRMTGSLTYVLNVIRDYKIAVELLTNLPEGFDDFIFSYFRYYNKLDPNGFQFSLQNIVIKKPEIVNILSLWKKKYPDIVLCDFLNNKINESVNTLV